RHGWDHLSRPVPLGGARSGCASAESAPGTRPQKERARKNRKTVRHHGRRALTLSVTSATPRSAPCPPLAATGPLTSTPTPGRQPQTIREGNSPIAFLLLKEPRLCRRRRESVQRRVQPASPIRQRAGQPTARLATPG